jgi:hypothetical protein
MSSSSRSWRLKRHKDWAYSIEWKSSGSWPRWWLLSEEDSTASTCIVPRCLAQHRNFPVLSRSRSQRLSMPCSNNHEGHPRWNFVTNGGQMHVQDTLCFIKSVSGSMRRPNQIVRPAMHAEHTATLETRVCRRKRTTIIPCTSPAIPSRVVMISPAKPSGEIDTCNSEQFCGRRCSFWALV